MVCQGQRLQIPNHNSEWFMRYVAAAEPCRWQLRGESVCTRYCAARKRFSTPFNTSTPRSFVKWRQSTWPPGAAYAITAVSLVPSILHWLTRYNIKNLYPFLGAGPARSSQLHFFLSPLGRPLDFDTIVRYFGLRLLPPDSWQTGPGPCAHVSNPVR